MAAYDLKIADETFVSTGTLTLYQAVIQDTSHIGQVTSPAGANAPGFGFAYDTATAGQDVVIRTRGIAVGVAASAINYGDLLGVADSSGRLQTVTPGSTYQNIPVIGIALQTVANANDQLAVEIARHRI